MTVKPQLLRLGKSQSPLVIIDEFSGSIEPILDIASRLAPYPIHSNSYPGVRRVITLKDLAANDYVEQVCRSAAQFIGGGFGIQRFNLLEASFSIVTKRPDDLSPPQRAPHFDTIDDKHLALLHYLRVPPGSGTAFYRHRATDIERVTPQNVDQFIAIAKADALMRSPNSGYIAGSDEFFEQIGLVEAIPDRLVIYQGSLLHSGVIPADMSFSSNPREGRLTANLFVLGK